MPSHASRHPTLSEIPGQRAVCDRSTDDAVDPRNAQVSRRQPSAREAVASLGLSAGSNVLYLACCGDDPELHDEAYDCVVAVGVLENAQWDRLLLRKLFCALRPGGYLIVSMPNRRYAVGEFDHLLKKVGFDVLKSFSSGFGPLAVGGFMFPHRLTAAIERGLEWASHFTHPFTLPPWARCGSHSAAGALLRDRGNEYLVVAQKPSGAGVAARLDVTPTLNCGIEGFEEFYKSEYDRLADWEKVHSRSWASLPPDVVHRALKRCRSAVVLSPHPDDELIGCGGVMLDLLDRGANVGVIQMTDGAGTEALCNADQHTRRTIRSEESKRVAEAMGVTHLTFLEAPNDRLDERSSYVDGVRRVLDELVPDVVFVPFINDRHKDHVAANLILDAALVRLDEGYKPLILAYEVWSLVPPHLVRPIDAFIQRKCDLLMMYPTPMRVVDYIWHCQIRDGHHSRRHLHREGYAEAYLALKREAFARLVASHRQALSAG